MTDGIIQKVITENIPKDMREDFDSYDVVDICLKIQQELIAEIKDKIPFKLYDDNDVLLTLLIGDNQE